MITLSGSAIERASKRGPIGLVAFFCYLSVLGAVASPATIPVAIAIALIIGITTVYAFHIFGEVLLCKYGCEEALITNGDNHDKDIR